MQRNMLAAAADKFWFSRQMTVACAVAAYNNGDYIPMRELLNSSFEDGARWNMRETVALTPSITRFLEMVILLGPTERNRDESELAADYGDAEGGGASTPGTPSYQTEPPY